MRASTSPLYLLSLLSIPLPLVSAQASSCAASYTAFSTYCCSGTLVSSATGSPSGTAFSSPSSGSLLTLPTNTLPAPTVTGTIASASGSLITTGLTTLPVSLPGPHPTSVQVTNPNTSPSNGVTYTSFDPLPSSDIIPLPGSQRHSASSEGVPPKVGSAVSVSGSVLGPGVTCFGAVSTVAGPGVTSATAVTSLASTASGAGASGSGSGSGSATGSGSAGASGGASGSASGSVSAAAAAPVQTGLVMEVLGAVVGVLGVGML